MSTSKCLASACLWLCKIDLTRALTVLAPLSVYNLWHWWATLWSVLGWNAPHIAQWSGFCVHTYWVRNISEKYEVMNVCYSIILLPWGWLGWSWPHVTETHMPSQLTANKMTCCDFWPASAFNSNAHHNEKQQEWLIESHVIVQLRLKWKLPLHPDLSYSKSSWLDIHEIFRNLGRLEVNGPAQMLACKHKAYSQGNEPQARIAVSQILCHHCRSTNKAKLNPMLVICWNGKWVPGDILKLKNSRTLQLSKWWSKRSTGVFTHFNVILKEILHSKISSNSLKPYMSSYCHFVSFYHNCHNVHIWSLIIQIIHVRLMIPRVFHGGSSEDQHFSPVVWPSACLRRAKA